MSIPLPRPTGAIKMPTVAQPRKKVIIIGAGVGGTSTAARLAHAGLDVEVYEKNEYSGGRCSLIHHDGYRFDQVGIGIPIIAQLANGYRPRGLHCSSCDRSSISFTRTSIRHSKSMSIWCSVTPTMCCTIMMAKRWCSAQIGCNSVGR